MSKFERLKAERGRDNVDDNTNHIAIFVDGTPDWDIARVWDDFEDQELYAKLFAASPELYDALLELAEIVDCIADGTLKYSEIDSFTTQPAWAALRNAGHEDV